MKPLFPRHEIILVTNARIYRQQFHGHSIAEILSRADAPDSQFYELISELIHEVPPGTAAGLLHARSACTLFHMELGNHKIQVEEFSSIDPVYFFASLQRN